MLIFLTEPEPVYAYKHYAYKKTCMILRLEHLSHVENTVKHIHIQYHTQEINAL